MTNTDLAWAIYQALKDKGAFIGTASVGIIERELNRAEAERWIPVAERLPEEDISVLLYDETSKTSCGIMQLSRRKIPHWFDDAGNEIYFVTHWQPLPEGPEVTE